MALFPSTSSFPFSHPLLLLLLLVGLCLFSPAEAQEPYYVCGTDSKFATNSTYQSNLNLLLPALASNASASFFDKSTVGQIPDRVYGLVYCRDDISSTECASCLSNAVPSLPQSCPYERTAMIGYDKCFLRFSDQQFLTPAANNSQSLALVSTVNVGSADVDRFNQLVLLLLENITERATANSTRTSSTGELSNFTLDSPTIYGMVQCTPDMSPEQCGSCLRGEFNRTLTSLVRKIGGRIVADRCIFRYEVYSFFEGAPSVRLTVPLPALNEAPASPPSTSLVPPLPSGDEKESKNKLGMVLAITLPIGAVLLLVPLCFCFRRRRRKQKQDDSIDPQDITSVQSIVFDLSTLRVATANFSKHNKLGGGGFGEVYKGLLPNGCEIAVKKLLNHGQGLEELRNELILVAKLQHRNLVKLLGVCLEDEKMIVYEYVPNKSLDMFLFDSIRARRLYWGIRYKIISGIARGLLYLHEESRLKIIHRDLKASNILLDKYLNPKISDFGLARLFDYDQTTANTSRVVGTFGYMAPEYAMHGMFSTKSDVFSFGILVLEILTGRMNNGSYNSETSKDLLSFTWDNWNEGTPLEIVDPALEGHYTGSDVMRCIQIGLLCVQENPTDRPTMETVNLMLNSETITMQSPSRPAFCAVKSDRIYSSSSDLSIQVGRSHDQRDNELLKMSSNDVSISEVEPR